MGRTAAGVRGMRRKPGDVVVSCDAGRDDEDRPNPLAVLLMSLLAPIAASLIQMAVSRSREFEADRGAAELLGNGHSLADALERIETLAARRPMMVAPAQAQAYIHNPLSELRGGRNAGLARLFSTHPATEERIARLRALTPHLRGLEIGRASCRERV